MAFPFGLLVDIGKAIVQVVRESSARRRPGLHWYPKHIDPKHTCYWCERYDRDEQELTDPPCVPTRTMGAA